MQARALRGAPAALARDDLIGVAVRAHHDWLDDAALGDRGSELVQRILVEVAPRLFGMGSDRADRDHPYARGRPACRVDRRIIASDIAEKGAEAPS